MPRSRRCWSQATLCTIVTLVCVPPLAARQFESTPEAIAEAYMSAMRTRDWNGMAALMHPDALGELRGLLGTVILTDEALNLRQAMLQVVDTAAVAALSDQEFFSRFIQFVVSQDPATMQALETAQIEIIGSLMEGETAHVMSRLTTTTQGIKMSRMQVSSFRQTPEGWRGLLTGDVSGLALTLQEMLGR